MLVPAFWSNMILFQSVEADKNYSPQFVTE